MIPNNLSPTILEQLLKIGFLTGSRAFGTVRKFSDWDIVYSIEDTAIVDSLLSNYTKRPSAYFNGYFIFEGATEINLIPVHFHEFFPWYLATEAMKATLKFSSITNKIAIHSMFMILVSMFKGQVPQLGSSPEDYQELKQTILSNNLVNKGN